MTAMLEHTNLTVADPEATAAWMVELFGWHIRWSGEATQSGRTVHVGTKTHYLALYAPSGTAQPPKDNSYKTLGGLNHIAVVVDDLDAMAEKVVAKGFSMGQHYDYEPGRRFYFDDDNGVEFEVVQYD